jgi:hypothetical protein
LKRPQVPKGEADVEDEAEEEVDEEMDAALRPRRK